MPTRSILAMSTSVRPSWRMRRARRCFKMLYSGSSASCSALHIAQSHTDLYILQPGRLDAQSVPLQHKASDCPLTQYQGSQLRSPANYYIMSESQAQMLLVYCHPPPGFLQLALRPVAFKSARAAFKAPQAQDWPGRPGRLMAPIVPIASTLMWGKLRNT